MNKTARHELLDNLNKHMGYINRGKAENIVKFGLGKRHKDLNKNIIFTDAYNIKMLERDYSKALREFKKQKVQCWECGADTKINLLNKIPYCKVCELEIREKDITDRKIYSELRTKFMFDRAMNMLEKQNKVININDYKEVSEVIKEYIEDNASKFDSSHEMLVAMELLRNRVHIKIQPTVAGIRLDFILKEDKVVLEVDGYLHEYSKEKDFHEDNKIRNELGQEWEIVRIPTKYLEVNITMLYDAVMEMKAYKQKVRKQSGGIIPEYYSEREQKALDNILK